MPGISGIGSESIINSIVRNTQTRSNFSILLSAKALQVQKEQGSEAVKLINTASQIRSGQVDLKG